MQNYPVGRVNLHLTFAEMNSSFLTISVDPDQTANIGAAWSGSTLFAPILT